MHFWKLICNDTDLLFGRPAIPYGFFQISKGFHKEKRTDVGNKEMIEPYGFVNAQ
jgi:hypothetical protein